MFCAFALIYSQVAQGLGENAGDAVQTLYLAFLKAFLTLSMFAALLAWWIVLTRESRHVAQEESSRQTHLLMQEIEAHQRTDEELQKALRLLANGGNAEDVLGQLARGLTNKLLHAPSVQLKKLTAEGRLDALAMAQELFALGEGSSDSFSDKKPQ